MPYHVTYLDTYVDRPSTDYRFNWSSSYSHFVFNKMCECNLMAFISNHRNDRLLSSIKKLSY